MGKPEREPVEPLSTNALLAELEEWRSMSDEEREALPLTPEEAREIERRVEALDRGEVELIPADEVFEELRRRFG